MKKINLILLGAFLVKSVFAGETAPMPEPEVRLESFADYQDWAVNTGYPGGTLIPGGVDGINQMSVNIDIEEKSFVSVPCIAGMKFI